MSGEEKKQAEEFEDLNDMAPDDVEQSDDQELQDTNQVDQEIPEQSESIDEPTIESLQAELEAQQAEFKDQLLRVKAEMENVRRRADKQVSDSRKYANEAIARELLTVRDSLQLAANTEIEADDSDAVKSMREGLSLTLKQIDALFEKFHVAIVTPEKGHKLDPNLHQAMTMVPSEEVEAGAIIETIQSGYQLHDRLLRPAMVVVAQK